MINGVEFFELETHRDNRGFFREIFRFSEKFPDIQIGQLSHSEVNQGIVKGWHGHVYQSQWNYVLCGHAIVALKDSRKDSKTFGKIETFEIGELSNPVGYFFPPGILHGYRCIKGPMHIVYITSGTYDLEDEVRENFDAELV